MIIVNNVMRQLKAQPIKDSRGEVIGYFKKDSFRFSSIYLENILDREIFLSIQDEAELIMNIVLMPKEIINLVFKQSEINKLNNITVRQLTTI